MKRYLSGLIGLALLGASPILAQAPTAAPPAAGAPVTVVGQPASGCCTTPAACCTTAPAACCTTPQCVPEHYLKETKKVTYGSGTETFCTPYCHGCFQTCDCESGHCGHPMCRHYLTKKVQTCQTDAIKCVPSQAPVCATGHCGAGSGCVSAAPAMATPYAAMPQGTVATTMPQGTIVMPQGTVVTTVSEGNVMTSAQQAELVIRAAQPR
jgi:hypothetical protein